MGVYALLVCAASGFTGSVLESHFQPFGECSKIVAFSRRFSVHMGVGSVAYVTYIHLRNLAPSSEYLPHSIYTFQGHRRLPSGVDCFRV